MGTQFFVHFLNIHRKDLPEVQQLLSGNRQIEDKDDVPHGVFTFEVLDKFAEYMTKSARKNCSDDPTKQLLSAQTIDNYFSAVKTYYTVHHPTFKKEQIPTCFDKVRWAVLRGGLVKSTKNRAAAAGVALSTPRETLSDDDFKIMGILCLTIGSLKYFMFLTFQCLLYQVGRRGAESATRTFGHLSTRNYVADGRTTRILTIYIQRDKNLRFQNCTIFPQADILLWWKDLTFLIAILVMMNCNSQRQVGKDDPMFPEFYKEAKKDQDRQVSGRHQKAGAVSGLFNKIYKQLYGVYEKSKDRFGSNTDSDLNPHIGSHSAKKLTCQHLSDYGNNPISTIFRVGWDLRSLHTLFDYVIGSKVLDDQAGRTLSGWHNVSHGSGDSGGLPPTFDDALVGLLEEEKEKQKSEILKLGSTLFGGCALDNDVQLLCLGALFKHWNSMIDCYHDDCHQHPVVHTMDMALRNNDISHGMFSNWCKKTEVNFKVKNIQGLPVREINDLPDDALVDVRTFSYFMEYYKQTQCLAIREANHMKNSFLTVKNELLGVKEELIALSTLIRGRPGTGNLLGCKGAPLDKSHNVTNTEYDESLSLDVGTPGAQMSFTNWYNRCRITNNSIEVFIHYHTYDLVKGHGIDLVQQKKALDAVPTEDDFKRTEIKKKNKKYNDRYYKCDKIVAEMGILLGGEAINCPVATVDRQKWEIDITKRLMEIFLDKLGNNKVAPLNVILKWHSDRNKGSKMNSRKSPDLV